MYMSIYVYYIYIFVFVFYILENPSLSELQLNPGVKDVGRDLQGCFRSAAHRNIQQNYDDEEIRIAEN